MSKTWMAVLTGAVIIAGIGFGVNQIFAEQGDPAIPAKEAAQKVEERYSGVVKEIELDDKGARDVYEIEMVGSEGEYEIKMDADSGEILKVEQGQRPKERKADDDYREIEDSAARDDRDDRPKEQPDQNQQQRIRYEEAKKIALSKLDGQIKEIELDEDDGRWIYEVEIKKGKQEAELEIDAYTGEILFLSVEHDD